MKNANIKIDLVKLFVAILKRWWLVVLCGVIGFAGMYWYTNTHTSDTYTASGSMYVYNGNPNVINYQYTNLTDLNSAVELLNTYMVVVKSNKVMEAVADRLIPDYPGITASYIANTLYMGSVAETGVLRVQCRTNEAKKSADICNAVLDVAPAEIIRVVSAGNIEIIDYATPPLMPDSKSPMRNGLIGAVLGVAFACFVILLLFMLIQRIDTTKDLEDNYTPPVLASIKRDKRDRKDPAEFRLTATSPMDMRENYAKLRMNLLYTLIGKENNIVGVTSAVSNEGKSTITSNLAISCAMSQKKVLLIDGDMRRNRQRDIFHIDQHHQGLSDVLIGECTLQDALLVNVQENLSILPAGHVPPNPATLLGSDEMHHLLEKVSPDYDLVLMDLPPVNIVSDPLAVSSQVAGCLFVTRQYYSDHREISKALISLEMTGMNVLGFVFCGEKITHGQYYYRKYYRDYYHKYDTQPQLAANAGAGNGRKG